MLPNRSAVKAMWLAKDREVEYGAGLALAIAGESRQAQSIAEDLSGRWPEDTSVRLTYLPVLRAQWALSRARPAEAVEVFEQAGPTELGVLRSPVNTLCGALYPISFRGLALCALGRGTEAAAEFQKILEHSGLVVTDQVGALARLQLGRACRVAGEAGQGGKQRTRRFWGLGRMPTPGFRCWVRRGLFGWRSGYFYRCQ